MDLSQFIHSEEVAKSCAESLVIPVQSEIFKETRFLSTLDQSYKGDMYALYGSIKSQMVSGVEQSIRCFKREIMSHPDIDNIIFEDKIQCIREPDRVTVVGCCVIKVINGNCIPDGTRHIRVKCETVSSNE